MPAPADAPGAVPAQEQHERLAYALLAGAVWLAKVARLPLRRLRQLLDMRYFHELLGDELPISDIAARLGVSPRTAAELARQLKANFLAAEREVSLPRRIEFALWSRPLGAGRIRQALGDVPAAEVQDAVDRMVASGRLQRRPGRTPTYVVRRDPSRMVSDELLARIDGLDHLLSCVSNVVAARFLANDPRALARTVSWRMRAQDLPRLRELYEHAIWEGLQALEAEVEADPSAEVVEMDLSVVWAPRADGGDDEKE